MLKQILLASVFTAAATAAFAQAAPPAAGGAAAPPAAAPAAPPAAGAPPAGGGAAAAPQQPMSFFVTSAVPGTGNLGGLAGADKICQDLATAAGSTKQFHAYLSTQAVAAQGTTAAQPAVNARDRIGNGPWFNSKGTRIALNVADLHGDLDRDRNFINKTSALDEKGAVINGVGDTPNQHDMLTGSDSLGRAFQAAAGTAGADMTCNNWTSDAAGPANRGMLGHTDRLGGNNTSWNSAHLSAGCTAMQLVQTGGSGRFYCFAIN
jgi:hypothetical protein